ncbi:hypothetical protein M5689_019243 [Euphorbia peplus]|nr:hypothetical protein M5689_019243 [Euphorbia peplus]
MDESLFLLFPISAKKINLIGFSQNQWLVLKYDCRHGLFYTRSALYCVMQRIGRCERRYTHIESQKDCEFSVVCLIEIWARIISLEVLEVLKKLLHCNTSAKELIKGPGLERRMQELLRYIG